MGKGLRIATALVALIGIAPWAIYIGGLAKLTNVLTDYNLDDTMKQTVVMLEWYIASAQIVYLVVVIATSIASGLHRSHSLLNMFLAVNTALLILRATTRISQVTAVKNGQDVAEVLDVVTLNGDPVPYLRAIAAGQVSTAAWNFALAIMISLAGTAVPVQAPDLNYAMKA